ncbi:MAG TPA: 4-hydroxy-3-methylbut-2-enyl diphosphate reductase [Planctomycetaceae bacterium]|nr:4-hydroxy-3-methylbut-2-enyl diphosphate reductase [Planctomycetaceae bacterium]
MRILRAEALGLCFGVRDALAAADSVENPADVTIHGELVHNEAVLVQLDARGFGRSAEGRRDVPPTPAVLVTAHGISDRERARLIAAGKRLIDTTCPLVRRVHEAAQNLQADGFHVLVIGRREHVEVRGIIEDLNSCDVLETAADVRRFNQRRLGIVCQSTTPPELARAIRAAVRARNPDAELRFIDTICQPTRDRQRALERLCDRVDCLVVVGGRNSNNTRRLVELAERRGVPAVHVQSAADLCSEWFAGCRVVGLTAGTSTLDETVDAVERRLRCLGAEISGRQRRAWSSRRWLAHFQQNAADPQPIRWERGAGLGPGERAAIARSVQMFQLGESGTGRHLLRVAQAHAERENDPEYVDAVRAFVAEEQRHAAELGRLLDAAGLPRLERQWTRGVFRWLRHRAGLELMLSVLLLAEVIAKVYYAALRHATCSPGVRDLCTRILRDEVVHIRFGCERLARLRRRQPRWVVASKGFLWRVLFAGTTLVVWWTHRRALRAGQCRFGRYRRRCRQEFGAALWWADPRRYVCLQLQTSRPQLHLRNQRLTTDH